jgi:hypothetical protein
MLVVGLHVPCDLEQRPTGHAMSRHTRGVDEDHGAPRRQAVGLDLDHSFLSSSD